MNQDKKKVLIIDDDPRNVFALSAVLRAKGYPCIVASGSAEGLEKLSANKDTGIVLLDMMMPEMDGYETIKVIRHKMDSRVPVIAVTAQAMSGDREKCMEAGADGYVSKPIDVDELLDVMRQYLK
jgi:two-component system cell cycle response regulator DivK